MRAILVATGESEGLGALNGLYASPMLPFLDRPFLQHVVEWLASRGFREFDVISCHLAEQVEGLLGEGVRWGVTIRLHLAREPGRAYARLRTIDPPIGPDRFLLAHADRLPYLDDPCPAEASTLFEDGGGNWTGWAWIDPGAIAELSAMSCEEDLGATLRRRAGFRAVTVDRLLDVRTFRSFLESQRAALHGRFGGLLMGAQEVEPGVWISRNVSLHPAAKVVAPVYLGEDCRVGDGARVGPEAVIGEGCILDRRSMVADAAVFPTTYVGEGVELADALAVGGLLIHVGLGSEMAVGDRYLLDALQGWRSSSKIQGAFSRAIAALLLLAFGPVLLGSILRRWLADRTTIFDRSQVVRLPAPADDRLWRTFALPRIPTDGRGRLDDGIGRVLPGLISVLQGDLRLVGVTPRRAEELSAMPADWRELYCRSHAGLITEASRLPGHAAGNRPEDDFAADAFYAASAGLGHDLRLLLEYLAGIVRGPRVGAP
ncbi:MAG: NDP-sugar synthase [Isosphaeraceae bacterium]